MRSHTSLMDRLAVLSGVGALVVAGSLFRAAPCSAESAQLELDWRSPEACAEHDRTLATVARLLGSSPRAFGTAPLIAAAHVTRAANGEWRLLLAVTHGDDQLTRELSAASCVELSDAAALILALVLDPELLSRASEAPKAEAGYESEAPEPEPQPKAPENVPAPRAELATSSHAVEPRRSRTRLAPFVELGPVVSLGKIPSPALGVSLSGGFDAAAFRLAFTGSFYPSRRATLAERPGASALLELRALSLSGCWLNGLGAHWRAGPCLVTEFGSIAARGDGVDHPEGGTQRWGASGASGLVSYASQSALELGAQGSLWVPWGRTDFRLAGASVYQPAVLSLDLRVYLGVRF